MLRSLVAWGDRWVSDEPPATLMHGDHELDQVVVCRHCGAEAPPPVSVQVNSPGLGPCTGPPSRIGSDLDRDRRGCRLGRGVRGRALRGRPAGGVRPRHHRRGRQRGLRHGLYVGCGNGRNLLPLLDAGLDLTGLDISRQAIAQLRAGGRTGPAS